MAHIGQRTCVAEQRARPRDGRGVRPGRAATDCGVRGRGLRGRAVRGHAEARVPRAGAALLALLLLAPRPSSAAHYTLVGWNNLGMHCMDGDYSVFSLLPPYNTILAQLIDDRGKLVADPQARGITVTYEAVADPDGSINTTAAGKTNFWDFVDDLFGVSLSVDQGLAGSPMPGPANTPRTMRFDAASSWFIAEGVPITPYDDAGHKSTYPMMRLVARDAARAPPHRRASRSTWPRLRGSTDPSPCCAGSRCSRLHPAKAAPRPWASPWRARGASPASTPSP